jgi:hypothetical protein
MAHHLHATAQIKRAARVAPFPMVTSDLASITRMVNTYYGTTFKEFVPTEDALISVRRRVEWMARRDSVMTGRALSPGRGPG